MKLYLSVVAAVFLSGCVKSSIIPMDANTFQVTAGAAPVCGMTGAQDVAVKMAAIETIRRGSDKFIISGGGYQNDVRTVGYTPVIANTTGTATAYGNGNYATAYGQSTTTYSGGQPIIGGSHNQALVVKTFKADDPAGAQAIDARQTLGPEWKKYVESGANTCF